MWVKAEKVSEVQRISNLIKQAGFETYSLNDMLETVKKQSRQIQGMLGAIGLVAMLVSSAVGTCIPLFFKKVGVDPAVASGPLITTMNDLVAVITYYGMSWIFLIEMFHLAG